MTLKAKLLESQDPNDWHEDPIDERIRLSLTLESGAMLVRQQYPFRARLLKPCVFNHENAGFIFQYCRTSWVPSQYPIQVFDVDGNMPRRWCFNSDEVEILPVE